MDGVKLFREPRWTLEFRSPGGADRLLPPGARMGARIATKNRPVVPHSFDRAGPGWGREAVASLITALAKIVSAFPAKDSHEQTINRQRHYVPAPLLGPNRDAKPDCVSLYVKMRVYAGSVGVSTDQPAKNRGFQLGSTEKSGQSSELELPHFKPATWTPNRPATTG